MKKINYLIGLLDIFFTMLICVQLLILKTYADNVIYLEINFSNSVFISICFLISSILLIIDKRLKHNILSNFALFLLIIISVLSIRNIDAYNLNYSYFWISCILFVLLFSNKIFNKLIKKY